MGKKVIKEEVVITTKEISGDSEKIVSVEKQTTHLKPEDTQNKEVPKAEEAKVEAEATTKEEKSKKKKKNPAKVLIPLTIIFLIILLLILGVFQLIERHKIKKDIENKIAYIEMGDLSWTSLSRVEISDELNQYMSGRAGSDEVDIASLIVKSNDISYKIGLVIFGKCSVSITNATFSFEDFISYCDSKGYTTNDDMIGAFDTYADSHDKDYTKECKVKYEKKHGKWICDYNDETFIDQMSGGMVSAYAEYYDKSLMAIQAFIESTNDQGEEQENEE